MNDLEQQLLEHKIRPTPMRILTLKLLREQKAALSLSAIELGMEPADRVTIYRTLKTFKDNGLIHMIDDGTGSPKYALCKHEHTKAVHDEIHVHFFCTTCEQTTCLENSYIPSIDVPAGYSPVETSLLIKGTCKSCA